MKITQGNVYFMINDQPIYDHSKCRLDYNVILAWTGDIVKVHSDLSFGDDLVIVSRLGSESRKFYTLLSNLSEDDPYEHIR